MKPAMTKEEWGPLEMYPYENEEADFDGKPHDVAARCLYGQPFGFTRADVVKLLTLTVADYRSDDRRVLDSIAARIQALLPPEG